LLPWLHLRRIIRRLPDGDPDTGHRLARFPLFAFWMVLGTSTFGYPIGALQVDHFAALPTLEVAKIMIQGPALGGLLAVAGYLMAERASQDLAVPPRLDAGDLGTGPGQPRRQRHPCRRTGWTRAGGGNRRERRMAIRGGGQRARSAWRSADTCGDTAGRWTRRRTARPRWDAACDAGGRVAGARVPEA
jgi:hypothetical protein